MESIFFYLLFYVCLIAFPPHPPFREENLAQPHFVTSLCLDKKNIIENVLLSSKNNGSKRTTTEYKEPEITYVETDMAPV